MIALAAVLLLGCQAEETEEGAPPQALVFNAPADGGHPGYQLQVLVQAELVERVDPEGLFVPVVEAAGPALQQCGLGPDDASAFLLRGMLLVDPLLGLHIETPPGDERSDCVARAFSSAGTRGPEDLSARMPIALTLHAG